MFNNIAQSLYQHGERANLLARSHASTTASILTQDYDIM